MAAKTNDISNIIAVSISTTPTLLNLPLINTIALFSKETPSWGDAYKIYTNATDVATDFGSTTNAAAIAAAVFAQQPNPLATSGYLVIVPRQSSGSETTQAAIARVINSVYFFGILVDEDMAAQAATFAALTTYIQTLNKMFFYASPNQADYAPGGLLDLLRSATKTFSRGLYYSDGTALDTQLMAAAYASRMLSVDWTGSLTALTMNLKALSGVTADTTVDQTQLVAAKTAGVDVYTSFSGLSALYTSGANQFADLIYGEFWLKFAIQTGAFNFLRATSTKIAQTEIGMEGLKNVVRQVCAQGINNGFLAPGTWGSPNVFGDPASLIRNVRDHGFYVYSTPLSQQTTSDRALRKAPLIQVAVKTAGAIHSASVTVQVDL